MSTLSERLQAALDRLPGKTQGDLAIYCGVKAPSVSNWFTGETKSLKAASLRKAAEFLKCDRDWLDTGLGLPGWSDLDPAIHDTPLGAGEAREMSLKPYTVPPFVKWEDVMKAKEPLPVEFVLAMPDDSLAPQTPRGIELIFETNRAPEPGKGILVQAADGRRYVRRYGEGRGGGWEAQARNDAFVSLSSDRDGLILLAVARGKLSGDV